MSWRIREFGVEGPWAEMNDNEVRGIDSSERLERSVGYGPRGEKKRLPQTHKEDLPVQGKLGPLHKLSDFEEVATVGFWNPPTAIKPNSKYELQRADGGYKIVIHLGPRRSEEPPFVAVIQTVSHSR